MSNQKRFIRAIAEILVLGEWKPSAMAERVSWLLDENQLWIGPYVAHLYQKFPINDQPQVAQAQLFQFIRKDPRFLKIWAIQRQQLRLRNFNLKRLPALETKLECHQPLINDSSDLACWLGLKPGQLTAYARQWRPEARISDFRRHHYNYHWRTQRNRSKRLIEAPKPRLAAVQRQIYLGLLHTVPLHPSCHGFRKGHSTYSYAAPHAGQEVVVRFDLQNFFMSIAWPRIYSLFICLGYRPAVAKLMAGLCCHRTPHEIIALNPELSWWQRRRLNASHLTQGSPSSPVIANIIAYSLDARLNGLAEKMGAVYTRYADDLAFSGCREFMRAANRLPEWVGFIAAQEGFSLNHRKTKIMGQAGRQSLAGLTVNCKPNSSRREYEQLKAILHNCIQYGPRSQNHGGHHHFKAHLQGRIAYIKHLNLNKGEKLQRLYAQINW